MHTPHARHLLGLLGHQTPRIARLVALVLFLGTGFGGAFAQKGTYNYYAFAKKDYYFGITLAYNSSYYRIVRHPSFVRNDSIFSVNSPAKPGFNIGFIFNLNLHENFDVRCLGPTVSFPQYQLTYTNALNETIVKDIQAVHLETPIHFRYKSAIYKDMRFFVIAGGKYSFDLASNSRARKAEGLVKILPNNFALEYGLGFQVFFPYFILSPEIKFSHGLMNIHDRNPSLIYSSPIDRLFSRGVTISFHFEG